MNSIEYYAVRLNAARQMVCHLAHPRSSLLSAAARTEIKCGLHHRRLEYRRQSNVSPKLIY
jgi:hypothetical protein